MKKMILFEFIIISLICMSFCLNTGAAQVADPNSATDPRIAAAVLANIEMKTSGTGVMLEKQESITISESSRTAIQGGERIEFKALYSITYRHNIPKWCCQITPVYSTIIVPNAGLTGSQPLEYQVSRPTDGFIFSYFATVSLNIQQQAILVENQVLSLRMQTNYLISVKMDRIESHVYGSYYEQGDTIITVDPNPSYSIYVDTPLVVEITGSIDLPTEEPVTLDMPVTYAPYWEEPVPAANLEEELEDNAQKSDLMVYIAASAMIIIGILGFMYYKFISKEFKKSSQSWGPYLFLILPVVGLAWLLFYLF